MIQCSLEKDKNHFLALKDSILPGLIYPTSLILYHAPLTLHFLVMLAPGIPPYVLCSYSHRAFARAFGPPGMLFSTPFAYDLLIDHR